MHSSVSLNTYLSLSLLLLLLLLLFQVGGRTFKSFKLMARAVRYDPASRKEVTLAQVESESFKVNSEVLLNLGFRVEKTQPAARRSHQRSWRVRASL
jgi:hypothetical protein